MCSSDLRYRFISFLKHIIEGKKRPMFELALKRPRHWPTLEIPKKLGEDMDTSAQSGKRHVS